MRKILKCLCKGEDAGGKAATHVFNPLAAIRYMYSYHHHAYLVLFVEIPCPGCLLMLYSRIKLIICLPTVGDQKLDGGNS